MTSSNASGARSQPAIHGPLVRSVDPFNAGTPLESLASQSITPAELFFVRNHGNVPRVHPDRYRLLVGGLTPYRLLLTLKDIRARFGTATVQAAIECAGNRRTELTIVEPIPGELEWETDAIGNATWTGVRLSDVLTAAGLDNVIDDERNHDFHVAFTGLDTVSRLGRTFSFETSIPISKARSPEVILAYEMNAGPLTPEHGYPLRLVVPGYVGARSVKWLSSITVRATPSPAYFQQLAYKLYPAQVRPETAGPDEGEQLTEVAVNSAICDPQPGARLRPGAYTLRGYAIGQGGQPVRRVEVSTDDGKTFVDAAMEGDATPWAWRLWSRTVQLSAGPCQLVVRASDEAGNGQPERLSDVWNFKGYANNAWHRVPVQVVGERRSPS